MNKDLRGKRKDLMREICAQLAGTRGLTAAKVVTILCSVAGGRRIVVPSLADLEREIRDNKIRTLFNGHNADKLARKYRLTTRHVYYILKDTEGGKI